MPMGIVDAVSGYGECSGQFAAMNGTSCEAGDSTAR